MSWLDMKNTDNEQKAWFQTLGIILLFCDINLNAQSQAANTADS